MRNDDDVCRCGHPRAMHEHYRAGSDCGHCGFAGCAKFRKTRRPIARDEAAARRPALRLAPAVPMATVPTTTAPENTAPEVTGSRRHPVRVVADDDRRAG
ncbi:MULTISPECIES: hypothetical protein [unclassified Gordonia (in: high G+C Gram-positive bacteria)]